MKRTLTTEEYKNLKESAYVLSAKLSGEPITIEEFERIINEEKAKYSTNKEAMIIFEYTVKYPSDIDLMDEIEVHPEEAKNVNYLAKVMHWPMPVVVGKRFEFANYNLKELLSERATDGRSLFEYAQQASFYELNDADEFHISR